MKTPLAFAISALALLAGCGDSGTPQERTEAALDRLIEACANSQGDYSGAEGLVLYTGSDRDRRYQDFASADGEERQMLNSACYRISRLRAGSDEYTITSFETESEPEGDWLVLNVQFGSDTTAMFGFLDVDGRIGLGDIDS